MEITEQGLAGKPHQPNGMLPSPGRPPCAHTKSRPAVVDPRAFSTLQSPPECLADNTLPRVHMCIHRKADIRDVLLALALKKAASTARKEEVYSRETEWRKQLSNAMPGNVCGTGGLESGDFDGANGIDATISSGGSNIRENSSNVCSRTECPTKSLLRTGDALVGSLCTCLRGRSLHDCIKHSEPTGGYDGMCAGPDNTTRCKSPGKTVSPVDTATKSSHTSSAVPICLRREDSRGGPSEGGELGLRNVRASAVPCEESSSRLLIERILKQASAVPSVSALTSCLATTLSSLAAVYSHTTGRAGDASSSPLDGITSRDLIRTLQLLRGYVDREIQVQKRTGETTLRILKLPPGKHIKDYYQFGPILDVCLQPPQRSERHSRRPVMQKRLHSPESTQGGTLKENCARKACKRKNFHPNPREDRPCSSSSTNDGRTTGERSAFPGVKEEKTLVPQMLNEERKAQGMTLTQPSSNQIGENTRGHIEETADQVGREIPSSSLPPPERVSGGCPGGSRVHGKTPQQLELSDVGVQATPETARTGGRPILRFAVAHQLPVGAVANPVKVIKSIDKQRIPASAGGDRLWRRLCERLLNLPTHPNVLAMETIFEDARHFHFVFERLEGGELFAFLVREKVIEEQVCQYIIYQILMALDHLHSHNLLHRDIKPENLVFRRRRQKVVARPTKCSACASSASQTSVSSSSSTQLPSSSSYQSSSSSSSQSYSESAGDHSPLKGTSSVSSYSSSSSSFSCNGDPSGLNHSFTAGHHHHSHHPSTSSGAGISSFASSSSATARHEAHTSHNPCSPADSSTLSPDIRYKKSYSDTTANLLNSPDSRNQEALEHQNDKALPLAQTDSILRQLKRDYELVLIDFDTCKMMEVPSEEYGEIVGGRRRLVGTYGYLAPEVLCGHPYSTQSDLWSVGIILYTLMTGFPPLPMTQMVSACSSLNVFLRLHEKHKGIAFDVAPLSELPLAQDLCRRLLCLSPKERLNSARVALSHPWFDTLNRAHARQPGRSTTSPSFCRAPVAGQTLPNSERRERRTVGNPHRFPQSCTQQSSPLILSSLRAALESTNTPVSVPESTTSVPSPSSASAVSPTHRAALFSMYRMPQRLPTVKGRTVTGSVQ